MRAQAPWCATCALMEAEGRIRELSRENESLRGERDALRRRLRPLEEREDAEDHGAKRARLAELNQIIRQRSMCHEHDGTIKEESPILNPQDYDKDAVLKPLSNMGPDMSVRIRAATATV